MSWPPPNYHPDHGTGYAVTFADFKKIISYPVWQDIAREPLKEWFGYEIRGERDAAVVTTNTGEVVNIQQLHEQIQSDPQRQYDLYQRAMSVWR